MVFLGATKLHTLREAVPGLTANSTLALNETQLPGFWTLGRSTQRSHATISASNSITLSASARLPHTRLRDENHSPPYGTPLEAPDAGKNQHTSRSQCRHQAQLLQRWIPLESLRRQNTFRRVSRWGIAWDCSFSVRRGPSSQKRWASWSFTIRFLVRNLLD